VRRAAVFAVGLAVIGVMTGCADQDRMAHAESLAAAARLRPGRIVAGAFLLTSFARIDRPDRPVTLYIEGDGLAWLSRTEPSADPTPRVAIGLALAAADPGANVVYLARPCQFTPMALDPRCAIPYWTGKRYAPEVVASLDAAVTHFAGLVPGQPIRLVGYSGGGALAALVAAGRHDVVSIRTVAGNLDDEFVNRLHQVSAMPQSLDAITVAPRLAAIPQIHFSGADDSMVPPAVAERFAAAVGLDCARVVVLPGMGHESDWPARWPALLAIEPACTGQPQSPG
jgi:hypothetical protein